MFNPDWLIFNIHIYKKLHKSGAEKFAYSKPIFNFAVESTFNMKKEKDYIRDITEIRAMMERSSKFLSLSGWAGIFAGIYALSGLYVAAEVLNFKPDRYFYGYLSQYGSFVHLVNVILLAALVLVSALITAVLFSYRRAAKKGEKLWNSSTRRLLISMLVPLTTGGVATLLLAINGLPELMAPLTLLFWGMSLLNAAEFTVKEVRFLGVIQMLLGLIALFLIKYSLLIWAVGFGVAHIVYGIYMYIRYER